jgi:Domain of unknown function (DUF222)/HNH endonuclease
VTLAAAKVSGPTPKLKYMFDDNSPHLFDSPTAKADTGGQRDVLAERAALEALESQICELAGHLTAATCRFLLLLADFDARQGWATWDMPSCAAWLSWKCQMGSSTARDHVRVARALGSLPAITAEFAAGRMSYSKVRALTRIADPDTDSDLAEMAGPMTANQLERFARAHHTVTRTQAEEGRLQRRLTWRYAEDGSLVLTARLPPEDGAALLTALRAVVRDAAPPDTAGADGASAEAPSAEGGAGAQAHPAWDPAATRATSTALADALAEIAESYLAGRAKEASDGDAYQVVVHADPAALAGREGARCHIEDGSAISPDALQQIMCNAVLRWMSHDDRGNILNVGRRRREPTPALRCALRERDRCRCRFPGCHRRATQAHHIRWWMDGGETSLDNLVSLCRYHHALIHRCGYSIVVRGPGDFTFLRPDGEPIENSPPLPEPNGQLHDAHDAEITPATIIPPWYGERLNLDYAISVLFNNMEVRRRRQARAAA